MALDPSPDFLDCSSQFFFFFCRFQRRIYKNFFTSVQCKRPPFTNTMFIDRSKFQEQFWKGSLKEHFYKILSKSWPIVSEKIFYDFVDVHIVK